MAIKIGHASIDENNKISGGKSGDQSGKEVCIRTWYNKNWDFVLRPKNISMADRIATACEQGCANNNIGYDQVQRNTLHNLAKANGYKLSTVGLCECDCSSFMTVCAIAGGVTSLEYTGNAPTTSTMKLKFGATGDFEVLTGTKYLINDSYLMRGDILVKSGSHTVMALENGDKAIIDSKPSNSSAKIGIDVSEYNKINNYNSVKLSGIKFAILKIMDKNLKLDKLFETHISGFSSVQIPIYGVYNYSYATTVNKAMTDAKKVIDYLKQYNLKIKVYLDVEDKCQMNLGKTLIDIINAYQEVIESAGYDFGLYTGMSFYNSYLKPYKATLRCKNKWIARYYNSDKQMNVSDSINELKKPDIGTDIECWQYTSKGSVNGISGNVDLNILYSWDSSNNIPSSPTISETQFYILGKVATQSTNLNIRKEPNNSSQKLGSYKKGIIIQIIAKNSNGWYRTKDGYISGDYVQESVATVVNCAALNMRSDPNSSLNNIIKILNKGTEITLLSESNGWYKSKANDGTIGWVSGKYIKIK